MAVGGGQRAAEAINAVQTLLHVLGVVVDVVLDGQDKLLIGILDQHRGGDVGALVALSHYQVEIFFAGQSQIQLFDEHVGAGAYPVDLNAGLFFVPLGHVVGVPVEIAVAAYGREDVDRRVGIVGHGEFARSIQLGGERGGAQGQHKAQQHTHKLLHGVASLVLLLSEKSFSPL